MSTQTADWRTPEIQMYLDGLKRRRAAEHRLPPLDCGRRDPHRK